MQKTTLLAALLALLVSPVVAEDPVAEDPVVTQGSPYVDLLAKAETLVTVQFVLKVKINGGGDQEYEGDITCPLIDSAGLILCSNTELGGYITRIGRLGRAGGVSAAPSDIEVMLADETEARKARLLVRDTDRDLAWIHLEEPLLDADRPYLDLTVNALPEIGDTLYVLRRMSKLFGAQPIVAELVLGAVTEKPRRVLVPTLPASLGFGLPVFTADGRLVGVTVLQMPSGEDEASFGSSMSMVGASLSMQEMIGGLILPAEDLVKATSLARETLEADRSR